MTDLSIDVNLETAAINAIRLLSADAIQQAKSGHPGLPMGTAAIAYTIWTRHLRHNPANPSWVNRDRFILSGGHGSMLVYALLYLTGYGLELEELKQFRQWGSRTPGHPEVGVTPGVETTTGPLGQGFSNGVGMAIAEAHLAAQFNQEGHDIIDHAVYAIVTDGDLMEGLTAEAASLAGHLNLGKLVFLYDDNRISIDGSTDLAFTEDRGARFAAYGWHVSTVADGNDVEEIDAAIIAAKADPRPSLIVCRTTIGYGMPTRAGTQKAHGEPPGDAELDGAKEKLGWPVSPRFYVPDEVLAYYRQAGEKGAGLERAWNGQLDAYRAENPDLAAEFERRMAGKLPEGWETAVPTFPTDAKGMATRVASGKTINALTAAIPELIGGSADLAPSTKTWIDGTPAFSKETPAGRNFHFGVREHGMASIVNGMVVHGGVVPFGATFLVFSDYMRGAMRVGAVSNMPSIWVFTHDSIGVGEDGPTHQPVEQVASLRAMPNLVVLRPGDANETAVAWKVAIARRNGPTALALTRQGLPTLDRDVYASAANVEKGAYILTDFGDGDIDLILMASGSELNLIVQAGKQLAKAGKIVRVVSFPSWELFEAQDEAYKASVLPANVTARLAAEAGVSQGWYKYVGVQGAVVGVDKFGLSAPYSKIYQEYGLTVDNIVAQASKL
ncbi:MAG: transketolase [Chloroflexi bacterium]|nr:transketolase [Chloroflexota bacterium]